ncbi:MAG: preprotein translocase subunit YajC [bacterium]
MSFFISDAWAEAPAAAAQPGLLESLIFPIGLVAILYFFMIRPQIKRQKEHKAMVSALQKGDEVQSMGGLMGKIVDIGENFVKLEVADDVIVTVRRAAIESVMPKGSIKEL